MKISTNVVVLVAGWLAVIGVGVYLTFFQQPKEIEVLQKAEEVARMKNTELVSLQTEHVSLTQVTNETLRKWHARYKVIPEALGSADVVGHLNHLTATGFKNFDIAFGGTTTLADYSYHTFTITGRGYFNDLYKFVWEVENGKDLYRVRDLSLDHIDLTTKDPDTDAERLEVMVSFTLRLEAYFNGIDGASAPVEGPTGLASNEGFLGERLANLPPVPASMLPARQPATNPFFPGIMQTIPPNTFNLIDMEKVTLVSIVGQKAVFQDDEGTYRTADLGEAVYLGRLVTVDPVAGRVVANLNKGGIYDEVVLTLPAAPNFRPSAAPEKK